MLQWFWYYGFGCHNIFNFSTFSFLHTKCQSFILFTWVALVHLFEFIMKNFDIFTVNPIANVKKSKNEKCWLNNEPQEILSFEWFAENWHVILSRRQSLTLSMSSIYNEHRLIFQHNSLAAKGYMLIPL